MWVWLKAYIITNIIMSLRAHTCDSLLNHDPQVANKCPQHEFMALDQNYAA